MNAHALTIFKVLRKQFSEEDANLVVEYIEKITKENIAEQEVYTTKSIQHQVEQKIDYSVEQKIEKEHKYLATKKDIMAVKEDIMTVREELQAFKEDVNLKYLATKEDIIALERKILALKEDMVKQYRSFLTLNLAIFSIITAVLIYLAMK